MSEEEKPEKFPFDLEFQMRIIKLMLEDTNFLIRCSKFVKKGYFDTQELEWVYDKIMNYFEIYKAVPSMNVLGYEVQQLKGTDRNPVEYWNIVKNINSSDISEKEFIVDKMEEWLKRNAFVKGFNQVKSIYNNGKFDLALNEMDKTMQDIKNITFDPPNRTFFFEDVNERIAKRNERIQKEDEVFSTGITTLDCQIGGGLSRGELGIVVASAKIGKSIFLLNCGGHLVKSQKAKVLHIQLEGMLKQAEDRYDSCVLNHNYNEVKINNLPEYMIRMYARRTKTLVLRGFTDHWNHTVQDIEEEMKELKAFGFIPDVLIVDYGDLLKPSIQMSNDSSYLSQQEVFRELKTLAMKYNIVVWTASQVTRAPAGKDPQTDRDFLWTRNNLADCFAKVRICDLLITLNMTDSEQQSNTMRVYLDAYRDAVRGFTLTIGTNYKNMQFFVATTTDYNTMARDAME